MSRYRQWRPYVPVAERRREAAKKMSVLRKKGKNIQPIEIEGRKIAATFWGKAWCDHLESFSDYANRLPRGRTYVRNGSVCHLAVAPGKIEATVSGSDLYQIKISVEKLSARKWNAVKKKCAGRVGSLLELLQGRLSDDIMSIVTDQREGLFPLPKEIKLNCSCPDWATMCKHVAAALYGVGARLDHRPELLFNLRGVDHEELIEADHGAALSEATRKGSDPQLAGGDLSDIFGIDIQPETESKSSRAPSPKRKPAKKKVARKRSMKATEAKKTPVPGGKAKKKPAARKKAAIRKKAAVKPKKASPRASRNSV
ncbi:MAG: putative Zn finger protein [Candidatus Binatia bacterium]|jgi:uncharacterized Zn finger protein